MKHLIYRSLLLFVALLMLPVFAAQAQTEKITTTSACRMFADIENISSVLSYVPKGKEVKVLEYSGEYALIEYEGTQGWIKADKTNAQLAPAQDKIQEAPANNYYNNNMPPDRFSILVEKYGYRTGKAIFEHKIWKGIDNNMVKDSWGKPLNVSREANGSGTIEIWTYSKSWLLLKNGLLSEWGPNK